ncbi:hypothetical protein OWR29_45330 [Actinoplanes sp. Pm04-4]|uniref:Serpin (Serine protease inhibitor) n=1 Tax=Paractinoplanes pyxinae TaxID=2997416 RepID=A0ABT4BFF1_9ACTN|nr:hypothetical protein [Actinoplanes pyxinae]MCY1145268.1 hypothetical protein [Actinoplanes pyxinae]
MTTEVAHAVARYAERFHAAAGDRHTVASPLGAWLLLALCGSAVKDAADGGRTNKSAAGEELAAVLGMELAEAAAAAKALLQDPHPLVPGAAAVWHQPGRATDALLEWGATLPATTATGPLPAPAELNEWARVNTLDLIDKFLVPASPGTLLVMASALATRISWAIPFGVAPARALGRASEWAGRLTRVLRSPDEGHKSFIASTDRAGDVVVHITDAEAGGSRKPGLFVVSVAAVPDVAPADVLAVAHDIALSRGDSRRSLFDLPLGESALWTITEEPVLTRASDGREERYRAVLPCWSANDEHDLSSAGLGFPAATRVLAPLLGATGPDFKAKQSTMAKYGRYGFEAAALTGFSVMESVPEEGVARTAELRFGHPYAVVAVATDYRSSDSTGPWHGLPVFSAWVCEPEDVPESEAA